MYRLAGEEEPAHLLLQTSAPGADLVLSHRDLYRIELALPPEPSPLFLYVYQLDSMGNLDSIYPNKFLETSNPVNTVNGSVQIPAGSDDWLYLSKLDEQATGLIKERLFILLSSRSLNEVEALFAGVHEATDTGYRKLMLERFLEYVERDPEEGPREFTVQKMHFWHGK